MFYSFDILLTVTPVGDPVYFTEEFQYNHWALWHGLYIVLPPQSAGARNDEARSGRGSQRVNSIIW